MQVKIVDGARVIQANARDVKVMREAAGLFGFILDVCPPAAWPDQDSLGDVKALLASCIDACSGDSEETAEELPAAAGEVT